MKAAICLCALLAGCAGALDPADAHDRANELREELNEIGEDVRGAHAAAEALCSLDAPQLAEPCAALADLGPAINDAWVTAQLVIDGLEIGASTFDAANDVLARARQLADRFGALVGSIRDAADR